MSNRKTMGTVEWTHWDRFEPVKPVPLTDELSIPSSFESGEPPPPLPADQDRAVNAMTVESPSDEIGTQLTISGYVREAPLYVDDHDAGPSHSRLPAHTPEWRNPQPGDPGRTLTETDAGETAGRTIQMEISGYVSTSPLYFNDEDFDLAALEDFAMSPSHEDARDAGTAAAGLSGHGILLDFEDDAVALEAALNALAESDPDTDDGDATTDRVQTPIETEPPVPHLVMQLVVVGAAGIPADSTADAEQSADAAAIV